VSTNSLCENTVIFAVNKNSNWFFAKYQIY